MKKLCVAFCSLLFLVSFEAQSQWRYVRNIFDLPPSQPHGVVVAPDGNIWIAAYGRTLDSLGGRALRSVTVLRPDGSPVAFSPIRTIRVGPILDTLYGRPDGARGIALDHEGNILLCFRDYMYRINYRTGEGMNRVIPRAGSTLTQPGVTATGDIVVGHVLANTPIWIYDKDFNLIGTVTDSSRQISRNIGVSRDGRDVYHCSVAGIGILRYHSPHGTLGPYALRDTIVPITFAESFQWSRKNPNIFWTSSRDPVGIFSRNTWYAIDIRTKAVVDSIKWRLGGRDSLGTPRGIAFSVTEDTAYVVGFDGHSVQMFTRAAAVSVERFDDAIPTGFTLSQNYPNPFNPSTQIRFTIPEAGKTTLKVYDILGKEVATLVNDYLAAGGYVATFDASNLPSGVYVYVLNSGGYRLSNKMMLVK